MLTKQRVFSIWALPVAAALMFVYCGDSDEPTEPTGETGGTDVLTEAALCVSQSSCAMGEVCDTSAAIDVTNCGNAATLRWTAADDAAWLSVTVTMGVTPAQFFIMADSNRTGAERTATVTVTAIDLVDESVDIVVTQPSLEPTLSVSLAEWEAYCLGEESEVISVTNCGDVSSFDWTVAEDEDWLELSAANGSTPGSFIITADTNHGEGARTGTVTVTAEGVDGSPWAISVEQPAIIAFAGAYDTPDYANNVYVAGDYAYVADWYSGLQIIDVSDPYNPDLAGEYSTTQELIDVCVQDDFAYVAGLSGFRIIDVSSPSDPDPVSFTNGYWTSVFVQGDYAYITGEYGLFYIINVSNPSGPSVAGGCMVPNIDADIFVSGDYAYMACRTLGLRVIDISDPSFPDVVGSCAWSGSGNRVVVSGDYAYVSDIWGGLQIIDVSDPSDPYVADYVSWPGVSKTNGVFVSGDYVYVTDVGGIVAILDISNPTEPVQLGYFGLGGDFEGIYVSGGYAYAAASAYGLLIFELGM